MARSFLSLCASLSFLGRHLVLTACWAAEDPPGSGEIFPAPADTAPPARPPLPLLPPGVGRAGRCGSSAPSRPVPSPSAALGRGGAAGAGRSPRRGRGSEAERRHAVWRGLPWLRWATTLPWDRGAPAGRACSGSRGTGPLSPPAPRALGAVSEPPCRPESLLPPPWPSPSPRGNAPGGAGASLGPLLPAGAPSFPSLSLPRHNTNAVVVSHSFTGSLMTWGRAAKCLPCVGRL